MWICEECWDKEIYQAVSTNAHMLRCSDCKHRRRCYLVVRKARLAEYSSSQGSKA